MNWKLILQLSLFGLAMAISTVYWIPSSLEPIFWIAIFIICAYLIATKCTGQFFLHGLFVSLVNSIWITVIHVLLFKDYKMHHADEVEMMRSLPVPGIENPDVIYGSVDRFISGLVLGLFAFIASKIWKNKMSHSNDVRGKLY
jgi:hypothetical protein